VLPFKVSRLQVYQGQQVTDSESRSRQEKRQEAKTNCVSVEVTYRFQVIKDRGVSTPVLSENVFEINANLVSFCGGKRSGLELDSPVASVR